MSHAISSGSSEYRPMNPGPGTLAHKKSVPARHARPGRHIREKIPFRVRPSGSTMAAQGYARGGKEGRPPSLLIG